MGEQRKQAAERLLQAYSAFRRAQARVWAGGKTAGDVEAYSAAIAELEAAELAALQLSAREQVATAARSY